MDDHGCAFDESIPLHRFDGAEVEAFLVGSISLTIELTEKRRIHLDYQGCIENRDTWFCKLPLCGEHSVMDLVQQTITVTFASRDHAFIHFSGGGVIELVRDAPGVDLARFVIGEDEYQA
jgi:hypothetical protein